MSTETLTERKRLLEICNTLGGQSHALTKQILAVISVPAGKVDKVELARLTSERAVVDAKWDGAVRDLVASGAVQ